MVTDSEIHDAIRSMSLTQLAKKYNLKENDELRKIFVESIVEYMTDHKRNEIDGDFRKRLI
jgi:hypothetical protein